ALHGPGSDAAGDGLAVEELIGGLDDGYAHVEARDEIDSLIATLSHYARRIVRMRFDGDLLQQEIAERVGISQTHVSRTLRASLQALRSRAAVRT
ncbi:MAG TPA: sigma factor-like helix-turn-helix DNA-binding protein, partial [Solirubrobacteraceae bacterium]|nr:sigma factor-like helix-turn-helix DNA-binding protein [Solirubrobacteraceae bacterium]